MADFRDILDLGSGVASVIPGGQPFAAGLQLLSQGFNLFGGKKKQTEAEKQQARLMQLQEQAMRKQQELANMATPAFQQLINQTNAPAYNFTDMDDPWSPAMTALRQGAHQDDVGLQVQRAKAAARGNVPRGAVGGSHIQGQLGAIDRQALSDNAAYARSLRIQGGEERYRNRKAAEDAQIQRLQMLTAPLFNAQDMVARTIGGQQSLAADQTKYAGEQYQGQLGRFGQAAKDTVTAYQLAKQAKTKKDGTGVGQSKANVNNVGANPTPPGVMLGGTDARILKKPVSFI